MQLEEYKVQLAHIYILIRFDAPNARSYHRQQARTRSTPRFRYRQDNPVQTRDEIRLTTLASCAG